MQLYLTAFFLTLVIELATAAILGCRERVLVAGIILVNLCTHPLLNLTMALNAQHGILENEFLFLCFLEIIVVFVEYRLLRDTFGSMKKPFFRIALLMNFNSFAAGVLLYWI